MNSTNANKDDLMKMKADGGKAWAVQSLGDWPHPHDQDQSTDNQVECENIFQSKRLAIFLFWIFGFKVVSEYITSFQLRSLILPQVFKRKM